MPYSELTKALLEQHSFFGEADDMPLEFNETYGYDEFTRVYGTTMNETETYQTDNEEEIFKYGGDALKRFAATYDPAHKPLTLVICIFGVAANALNIIVLTRKRMISPTNVLLTGLSVNQLLLLLSYLSLLLFNFLLENCLAPCKHSYFDKISCSNSQCSSALKSFELR